MANAWCLYPSIFCLVFVSLFIALQASTWRTVGSLEWGISYNSGSISLGSLAYGPGRYGVGPGTLFMTFPSTVETCLFTDNVTNSTQTFPEEAADLNPRIIGRSSDGLKILMSVVVNYQLGTTQTDMSTLGTDLVTIYTNFENDWAKPVAYQAESAIQDVMSQYTASNFFSSRTDIGVAITNSIKPQLLEIKMTQKLASIINIDMPQAYYDEVERTQIASQGVQEKTYQKSGVEVQMAMNEAIALINKDITIAKETSQGTQYSLMQQKKGEGLSERYTYLSEAYTSVKASGLTINDGNSRKFQFVHWIMSLKFSQPATRKILFKNLKGLSRTSTAV